MHLSLKGKSVLHVKMKKNHQLYEQYKENLFTNELPPGLPVSRGEFDHKIKLIDDRKTYIGYTVRPSTLEQDQLKVVIDDMLEKGFLSPSSFQFLCILLLCEEAS